LRSLDAFGLVPTTRREPRFEHRGVLGDRLVGSVRILSDGYFFNTVPEVIVDPDYQRQGIGRELMHRALELAPGGRLFFGAQPGNEPFFEKLGFQRGPVGFVGRREDILKSDAV
jgi:GNAT superfamily N-acetyltransferase